MELCSGGSVERSVHRARRAGPGWSPAAGQALSMPWSALAMPAGPTYSGHRASEAGASCGCGFPGGSEAVSSGDQQLKRAMPPSRARRLTCSGSGTWRCSAMRSRGPWAARAFPTRTGAPQARSCRRMPAVHRPGRASPGPYRWCSPPTPSGQWGPRSLAMWMALVRVSKAPAAARMLTPRLA